jgi:hypothetical protein
MMGRRSTPDRMIDDACGYDPTKPTKPAPELVTVLCPIEGCKFQRFATKTEAMPKDTAVVFRYCWRHKSLGSDQYFYDRNGNQLTPKPAG